MIIVDRTSLEKIAKHFDMGYVSIISTGIDIKAFSKIHKSKEVEIPSDIVFGTNCIQNSLSGDKVSIRSNVANKIYSFDNVLKRKFILGAFSITYIEYESVYNTLIYYIMAHDEADAIEALNRYYQDRANSKLNRSAVLDHYGSKVENFQSKSWDNIFLPNGLKEHIMEDIGTFFQSKDVYSSRNIEWRRGMILAGPAGNGKTSICKAIATSATVPVIYVTLNEDPSSILSRVHETIGSNAPCIVIFEEAEALTIHDISRATALSMFDGLFSCDGVFIIACTNKPEMLDAAFVSRPGRFDSYHVIPNPNEEQRLEILKNRLGADFSRLFKSKVFKNRIISLIKRMRDMSAAAVQEIAIFAIRESINNHKTMSVNMLEAGYEKMKNHLKASKAGQEAWTNNSLGFHK